MPPEQNGTEARTLTLGQATGQENESPTALYVTGPHGGTRYLLPDNGIVRIGRSADCTITLGDPRVSRSHAAVSPKPPFEVTDLGSANGTFVAGQRLLPGQARAIAPGETFFVGDSALVLRPSGLRAPLPTQLLTWEQLSTRLHRHSVAAEPDSPRTPSGRVLLKVRVTHAADLRWVASILADPLTAPIDWMVRLGDRDLAVAIVGQPVDAAPRLREALRHMGSWNITATAESTFVPDVWGTTAEENLLAFFRGSGAVHLQRGPIVIQDPAMKALHQTLMRVAAVPVNLLVLGETGVGKDIVAAMVHELSPRSGKPFVRLNCASLPEALLENELFGHERGAFTGAVTAKPGLLETADGGTIFLDEIGDLALPLQAKLLHAIESCEIMRLGGLRAHRIDVRFVFATNRALDADVEAERFRRDLFHRITGVVVTVPPLRARPSEIEPLARQFLASAAERFDVRRPELSAGALAALAAHPWRGNVRELRNVVERAVLLAGDAILQPHHLGLPPAEPGPAGLIDRTIPGDSSAGHPSSTPGESPANERASIEEALIRCGGNQSRAAELLGMPRRTLVRRIANLGLPRPRRPER